MSEHETYLINVDMDLFSRQSLKKIVNEIAGKVSILHEGEYGEDGYFLRAEVLGNPKNIDDTIAEFLDVVGCIKNEDLLGNCTRKEFNVGIESGTRPVASEFSISNHVMQRVVDMGFAVIFTVYGYNKKKWSA